MVRWYTHTEALGPKLRGALDQSDGKVEKSHSPLLSNSSPAETLFLGAGHKPHPISLATRGQPRDLAGWQLVLWPAFPGFILFLLS